MTPKAYTAKSPSGPLPPDSGPTTKKTFEHTDCTYELWNAHNYSIVFKISIILLFFLKI